MLEAAVLDSLYYYYLCHKNVLTYRVLKKNKNFFLTFSLIPSLPEQFGPKDIRCS